MDQFRETSSGEWLQRCPLMFLKCRNWKIYYVPREENKIADEMAWNSTEAIPIIQVLKQSI